MAELISVAVVSVCLGAVLAWSTVRMSRGRFSSTSSLAIPESSGVSAEDAEIHRVSQALVGGDEVYVSTGRADEFIVYSSTRESSANAIPTDLALTAASSVSAVLRGGVEAAQAAGRLVLVDGATAKAIRDGAMATDRTGKTLAVVRGAGGKWEHVTRMTPSAGKVAGGALAAANVLGAVSTQMQMASIEAKLSEIVEGVQSLENIARRELDSSIYATRKLVHEVVGASRHAGQLPEQSWAMIAPHFKDIIEDQQMARGSVEDLLRKAEIDPKGFWLSKKATSLQSNRDLLVERLHTLKEADLNVVRMHIVRLWHYTVVQPELASYFEELARSELQEQSTTETRLLTRASQAIAQHGELGRLEGLFHWSKSDDFRRQVEQFSDFSPLGRLGESAPGVPAAPGVES